MTHGPVAADAENAVMAENSTLYAMAGFQTRRQTRPAAQPVTRQPVRTPTRQSATTPQTRVNGRNQPVINRRTGQIETRQANDLARRAVDPKASRSRRERMNRRLQDSYGLSFMVINNQQTLVRYQEIIGINMTDESRVIAKNLGFRNMRRMSLVKVGALVDLLRIPQHMTMLEAYTAISNADKQGVYRYNAVYTPTSMPTSGGYLIDADEEIPEKKKVSASGDAGALRIGMIDTGVKDGHKMLAGVSLSQYNWGRGEETLPRNHGTAVASILASGGNTTIINADVFSGAAVYADAESIVVALNWLAQQNVGVINISLAGPPNDLLQLAVSRLIEDGHILVAAVGNTGADSPALYPAAYPGVLGVTAVDKNFRIYKKAYTGRAVDFAALGVKIRAASVRGRKKYSGTSFATPIVASYLSLLHRSPDQKNALSVMEGLLSSSIDLGAGGYDKIFGFGVVGRVED